MVQSSHMCLQWHATFVLTGVPTPRCQQVIARHEGHLGYEGQVEFLEKVPDFDV